MANYIGYNTGEAVMPGFNFILRVEMAQDCPCRAIKGLRRENEFDYIQEGGLNDYVHMKRKPISRPFTFQVERYAGIDYLDPLALGTELTLPLLLMVYDRPVFSSASNALSPHRTYVFTGCTVISKDYGDLNAENSGLVVETTTIAFRQMACIDNFVKAATDDWMTTANTANSKNEKNQIRNNSKGGEASFIRPNFEETYETQRTTYKTDEDGKNETKSEVAYKYQKSIVDKSGQTSNKKQYERNTVDTSVQPTNEKQYLRNTVDTSQVRANSKVVYVTDPESSAKYVSPDNQATYNDKPFIIDSNKRKLTANGTSSEATTEKTELRNNVDASLTAANEKTETRNNVDTGKSLAIRRL